MEKKSSGAQIQPPRGDTPKITRPKYIRTQVKTPKIK